MNWSSNGYQEFRIIKQREIFDTKDEEKSYFLNEPLLIFVSVIVPLKNFRHFQGLPIGYVQKFSTMGSYIKGAFRILICIFAGNYVP